MGVVSTRYAHVGMIIHPSHAIPGYVGFTVPFSFAVASLITGRTDDRWIRITRRWCLVAWLFLSLGLILGAGGLMMCWGGRLLGLGPGRNCRFHALAFVLLICIRW
jgi:cytochrome c-type biogenesis protein CcmF